MFDVQRTIDLLQLLMESLEELIILLEYERTKRWLNRRWLVRPINSARSNLGFYNTLYKEICDDDDMFIRLYRMDRNTFEYLLKKNKTLFIKKENKNCTSGDEILSLAVLHRIGESTAYSIIQETCIAIEKALSPTFLKAPVKQVWKNIAKGFNDHWNLPNCIGAVDGRHMEIKAPPNAGSLYYNYKKTNSVVLLASCNHRYEFTIIDVGAFGSESDGGIFARSEFGEKLKNNELNLPEDNELPNTNVKVPYFFVGDEAFSLSQNFMRPFPGRNLERKKRIFNYRLSRARRCIENAFGILKSRWRVFEKPLGVNPYHANSIITAAVCLHNYLMGQTQKSIRNRYCTEDSDHDNTSHSVNNNLRSETDSNIPQLSCNKRYSRGVDIRNQLADYFISPEGSVSWQDYAVDKGCNRA